MHPVCFSVPARLEGKAGTIYTERGWTEKRVLPLFLPCLSHTILKIEKRSLFSSFRIRDFRMEKALSGKKLESKLKKEKL
jgi:hypothetical protein